MDNKQFVGVNPCVRPATLFDYLSHYATTTPDKIALIDTKTDRAVSYRHLNESIFYLAAALSAFRIGKGTKIIAIMEKSVHLVELILAASSVEALILHIPTDNYQLMLQQLLIHFVPDLVIIDEHITVKQARYKCVTYNQLRDRQIAMWHRDDPPRRPYTGWQVTSESPLYVNYSSGSTGIPKLAIATHRHVIANTASVVSWFNMSSDDVQLCNFRSHAHEFFCFALYTGGTAVLLADFNNPRTLSEALVHYQVTCLLANPATYVALQSYVNVIQKVEGGGRKAEGGGQKLDNNKVDNFKLRLAICGGALTSELLRERVFQWLKTSLIEVWGSTETTGNAIANFPGKPSRPGAAGVPINGYQLSIVREDGSLVEMGKGELGELIIQGESIVSGYLNASEASEDKDTRLSAETFRTGDIAYQDQDGFLYIQGRTDTKFKIGGHWVHPEVVERIFKEDKRVSDILITDVPINSLWGQLPAAMIVFSKVSGVRDQGSVKDEDSFTDTRHLTPDTYLLRQICRRAIRDVPAPLFSMPRYFLVVDRLPKNAGGKISRQDAKTTLTLALKQGECIRIPMKLSWTFKSAVKTFGKWELIKLIMLIFSHPLHAVKVLREVL